MGGVYRNGIPNNMPDVFRGYIVLPDTEDRDKYIQDCFRKERVDVYLENGTPVKGCYISKSVLQDIYFPENGGLGSAVILVTPKFYDIPVVIGAISKDDETQLLEENSFKRTVSYKGNNVTVYGKGKTGELFINVESSFEDEGNINITLRNKNKSSKFNLKCFGDINIYSEGDTVLKSMKNVDLKTIEISDDEEEVTSELLFEDGVYSLIDKQGSKISSDENGNIDIVPSGECKLFSGGSPLVKGDELKSQLEIMKNRIDMIINALNAGAAASVTSVTYAAAVTAVIEAITEEEDFSDINSEKSFTD